MNDFWQDLKIENRFDYFKREYSLLLTDIHNLVEQISAMPSRLSKIPDASDIMAKSNIISKFLIDQNVQEDKFQEIARLTLEDAKQYFAKHRNAVPNRAKELLPKMTVFVNYLHQGLYEVSYKKLTWRLAFGGTNKQPVDWRKTNQRFNSASKQSYIKQMKAIAMSTDYQQWIKVGRLIVVAISVIIMLWISFDFVDL